MDFTDGRADDIGTELPRSVLDHEARGEVADYDAFPVSRFPFPAQDRPYGKRERVIFSDRRPGLVHDREAIDVRVHGDAYLRARAPHQGREVAEVLRNRLRRAGKAAVRFEVDPRDGRPLSPRAGADSGETRQI